MKHGNNLKIFNFFLLLFSSNIILAEEKILSSPLINLDQIQPSFEVSDDENESFTFWGNWYGWNCNQDRTLKARY